MVRSRKAASRTMLALLLHLGLYPSRRAQERAPQDEGLERTRGLIVASPETAQSRRPASRCPAVPPATPSLWRRPPPAPSLRAARSKLERTPRRIPDAAAPTAWCRWRRAGRHAG